MLRNVLSVVGGYVIWTAIFLGGAAVVRAIMPDVFDEAGFTTDVAALVSILVLSIVASVAGGFACAKIATSKQMICGWILAFCLLATGIPVQLSAWNDLPVWYNLAFLILLVPATIMGVRIGLGGASGETQSAT